ncbi:hypothetical protein SUGI_0738640 [Cryptomeria japonica]|uniref:conserved oligomeric Golgi complex subunit 8 n=1 Tax=Cryptomeria japonica TaxID=3369 RepID=UPI0024147AB6|nr:conserved oligomeric Golgi complex subunit 8 [Cryptomeria japonica]GLJ36703.1 hypothetical protein SUGI_0738640 [Cryptomeria japonica]
MASIAANSQAAMAPRIVSLANAAQQPYVSELLSYTLDRLHKEPELLRVDAERLKRQMQEVAVGHYRAFITAADALQSVGEEVSSIDKHLQSLISEAPKLSNGCNEFMDSAQQILEKRRLNHTLLANHNALLDLLEIPQLMDTCVRNGNYDEALDLEGFVSKLATMHPKLPVIQSLAADVKQTTQSMLSQLLQRLRSNIQLPECLRVIGYLRRLGVFNEQEMRLQFLRCREAWLMGIIDELDQGNVSEFLKRMADCHRVHLFDVVTQYRAIFADDTSGNEENYDGGLLFSWAMHRITSHLNVLQIMLPKITEGAALANILDQCMYCAMSLGWVGLDFRGLLPALFEASMHNLFVRNMAATIENFQLVLDSHRWVPLPLVKFVNRGNTDETDDGMAPPDSLMEHPPLAMFVNGVLATLNELRYCAPINLKSVLALELVRTFQTISDYLVLYNRTRILRESESTLFLAMCRAFIEVACPYCIRCFSRSYPGGVNSTELNKSLEGVYNLVGSTALSPSLSHSILNETSGTQILPSKHNSLDSRKQALEDNLRDPNVLENGGTAMSENGDQILVGSSGANDSKLSNSEQVQNMIDNVDGESSTVPLRQSRTNLQT